eukprot:CAMPEP_0172451962 /NCGR_PEP_ID=MMETSP1065-20121228/9762_1 /TAXON_ID=265537 /ORGANISM="Amphiprora paludosa, Strain CCMP125" /LENGTH=348 /DNA_ID=CAMNT_0013203933 /DNA_START=45 /DNA_END=1091 /DNA_ORIENTATION=+
MTVKMKSALALAATALLCCCTTVSSFGVAIVAPDWIQTSTCSRNTRLFLSGGDSEMEELPAVPSANELSRRDWLMASLALASCQTAAVPVAWAEGGDDSSSRTTGPPPRITDKIYLTIKGLPRATADAPPEDDKRIVIGLYGEQAPQSVAQIKALVTQGLPSPCKPRAERTLQKEQLEANKVYNSCKEQEDQGVQMRYSTVWRIIPNLRVDLGAVTGKFVAREYPNWSEDGTVSTAVTANQPGVVSVRRGNESGFGLTICTGNGDRLGSEDLESNHIAVGRVVEGLDVVEALNKVPVITTAKQVNYMSVAGGNVGSNAPNRSCRYGGPMYCNENKPLVKLTVTEVGMA